MFSRVRNGTRNKRCGYALLTAILAINMFAILALMARSMWETEIQRDLEAELLFRAGQYRNAVDFYMKKNNNLSPKNLEVLFEKKFLRLEFKDPFSEDGKWNVVMQSGRGGSQALLLVPQDMVETYTSRARIVGVASASPEEGFRVYRGKKRYNEWAVYIGEKVDKEMPELKFVTDGEDITSSTSGAGNDPRAGSGSRDRSGSGTRK